MLLNLQDFLDCRKKRKQKILLIIGLFHVLSISISLSDIIFSLYAHLSCMICASALFQISIHKYAMLC